jgi:hypothetical protein
VRQLQEWASISVNDTFNSQSTRFHRHINASVDVDSDRRISTGDLFISSHSVRWISPRFGKRMGALYMFLFAIDTVSVIPVDYPERIRVLSRGSCT